MKQGENKVVSFKLTAKDLVFYTKDMSFEPEPGEFMVFVGPDSAEGLTGRFTLK